MACYEQALAIARQERNRTLEGRALSDSASPHMALGQWTNALASLEQALVIWRGLYDRARRRSRAHQSGPCLSGLSQYASAITSFEQALAIARQGHDRAGERWPLLNWAGSIAQLGRYDQARVSLEQAVAVMREVRDWRGEVRSLIVLGSGVSRPAPGRARDRLPRAGLSHGPGRTGRLGPVRPRPSPILGGCISACARTTTRWPLEQALAIRRELGTRHGVGPTLDDPWSGLCCAGPVRPRQGYLRAGPDGAAGGGDRDGEGQVFGA